jgi:hypothetical protein
MTKSKIEEFQKCLDEERFYDAHEALEALWFPRRFEKNAEILLQKGLINAAVSFELHKRGRSKQSKKVWANYLKYRQFLFKVEPTHLNDYYQLSRKVEALQKKLH